MVFYHWAEIVGDRIARVASPDRVLDGILHVRTLTAAWAQELSLLKPHILKELNARMGKGTLSDIRFHSGLVPQPEQVSTVMAAWDQIPLSQEELTWLEEEVAPIADPELQALVRQIRVKEEKRRKLKLRQGFQPCQRCGILLAPDEACRNCSLRAS